MSESRIKDELRARIAELRAARAQFPPLSRPMISTAYIDESGTHDGSPMTVMAGYLSSAEGWAAFNAEWGTFLAGLGVDHLHAKHLFHGEKSFKNLSWSRRAEIADEAKAITMKYATVGLSVILTNDEYQEIFKENVPKNVTFDFKYGICFRHIMSFLPQLVNIVQPDKTHEIFIVLEAGHKNQGAAAAMLAEYKSIADRLLARMVKGVSYAEKRECFGVQAADMLAFTSLRIEREELVKQVTTDITSETVIEGHNRPYVFRIPITRETLAHLREGHIELAKWRRRTVKSQKALDTMSATREAINAYLETQR